MSLLPDTAKNPGGFGVTDSLDALMDLHTLSVDTQRGFLKMQEKAQADFLPVANKFSTLHGQHIVRLATMIKDMGGLPDADGSFMGAVNTAAVTLRALFDDIDSGVMTQVRRGEDQILAAFDRAIDASLPEGHADTLRQMKSELITLLDDTRDLT